MSVYTYSYIFTSVGDSGFPAHTYRVRYINMCRSLSLSLCVSMYRYVSKYLCVFLPAVAMPCIFVIHRYVTYLLCMSVCV